MAPVNNNEEGRGLGGAAGRPGWWRGVWEEPGRSPGNIDGSAGGRQGEKPRGRHSLINLSRFDEAAFFFIGLFYFSPSRVHDCGEHGSLGRRGPVFTFQARLEESLSRATPPYSLEPKLAHVGGTGGDGGNEGL